MIAYAIAATPRVGGNWLCRMLSDTGAGAPGEHLNWALHDYEAGELIERDWTYDDIRSLWFTHAAGDIYAVKVHWTPVVARLEPGDILPPVPRVWFRLRREDSDAQARSFAAACQWGNWQASTAGLEIDDEDLAVAAAELAEMNEGWDKWFALWDIDPVELTYEQMRLSPGGVVAKIRSYLGRAT